jgi:hypothetical protein
MNNYDIGDLVRVTAEFKDIAGVVTDPTTVKLRVRVNGVTSTYDDAVRDSAGEYHRDLSILSAGVYTYRWLGTGAVQTAKESSFSVKAAGA